MSRVSIFSIFSRDFSYKYSLPEKEMSRLVDQNINKLFVITPILFIFGVVMETLTLISKFPDYKESLTAIIYYAAIILLTLIILIYLIAIKHHKNWNSRRKNFAFILEYFLFMFLSTYAFYYGINQLNSFILFAIVSVIAITFFTIRPFYYTLILFIFTIIFLIKCILMKEIATVINILIFTYTLWHYSFFKWMNLVETYNHQVKIKEHTDAIEREIKLASYVQKSFYKKDISNFENFEVRVYNKAMAGVSGDLYDFFSKDSTLDGLCLFDVSGHGISSGLVTMLVRNIISQEFYKDPDLKFTRIADNIDLRFRTEKGNIENYMTGILVRIKNQNLEIINAGHQNPILFRRNSNSISQVDVEKRYRSTVIGLNDIESTFNSIDLQLESGDELILYTDGIIESINNKREQYGRIRLLKSFEQALQKDINDQIPSILKDFQKFTDDAPANDDVTIIIIKRK